MKFPIDMTSITQIQQYYRHLKFAYEIIPSYHVKYH